MIFRHILLWNIVKNVVPVLLIIQTFLIYKGADIFWYSGFQQYLSRVILFNRLVAYQISQRSGRVHTFSQTLPLNLFTILRAVRAMHCTNAFSSFNSMSTGWLSKWPCWVPNTENQTKQIFVLERKLVLTLIDLPLYRYRSAIAMIVH